MLEPKYPVGFWGKPNWQKNFKTSAIPSAYSPEIQLGCIVTWNSELCTFLGIRSSKARLPVVLRRPNGKYTFILVYSLVKALPGTIVS